MITQVKYFLVAALVWLTAIVKAQDPKEIPNILVSKLVEFDSVLLVYYTPTNGGTDHFDVGGYGLIGERMYKLDIGFKVEYSHNTFSERIILKKINKKVVEPNSLSDTLRRTQFSSIISLNADSLGETLKCGASISDALSSTLLLIKRDKYYGISSYQPEFYQHLCPTKDRAVFLETKQRLERFLKSSR